jgi:hypothetical protein
VRDLTNEELIRQVRQGDYYSLETAELIRRFSTLLLKDKDMEKAFVDIMKATPKWASVMPVSGDNWTGTRYKK